MAPPNGRLTFAVSSALLVGSTACTGGGEDIHINVEQVKESGEAPPEDTKDDAKKGPEDVDEQLHVNPGPEDDPELKPQPEDDETGGPGGKAIEKPRTNTGRVKQPEPLKEKPPPPKGNPGPNPGL